MSLFAPVTLSIKFGEGKEHGQAEVLGFPNVGWMDKPQGGVE